MPFQPNSLPSECLEAELSLETLEVLPTSGRCFTISSSGGEGVCIIGKFNGENFGMWKFKMEMILAEKDLWDVADGSEEPPSEDADLKTKKAFERKEKKAFALIVTNLADQQIAHIRHCKTPAQAWKTLCNIHETKSLSNILFLRRRFFTTKMQEEDDLLDHVNKIKALADELACLEAPVTEGDVVMTLLESLPPSFEFLITALETRPMKEQYLSKVRQFYGLLQY